MSTIDQQQASSSPLTAEQQYIEQATRFLCACDRLVNSFVLDFFVDDLWAAAVPPSWQEFLDDISATQLADLISVTSTPLPPLHTRRVPPLSLLAYRHCCAAFALRRQPLTGLAEVQNMTGLSQVSLRDGVPPWPATYEEELLNTSGQNKYLPKAYRKHIKAKKQHEVYRASQLIDFVCRAADVDRVLDIGSGMGHISRLLTLQYGLDVRCFEADAALVTRANEIDKKTVKENAPQHCNEYIPLGEEATDPDWSSGGDCTLIALHTCGELAVSVIREFAQNRNCKALVQFGCCYFKLNGGTREWNGVVPEDKLLGYPLSCFTQSLLPTSYLAYEPREVACHALEKYTQRLRKEDFGQLEIHCSRALLEWFVVRRYPHLRHQGLHSVKRAREWCFSDYAETAVKRCAEIDFNQLGLAEHADFIDRSLARWRQVVAFYCLRLMLGPVIESVLLVDRLLYLRERSCGAWLLPVFDPCVSPRNIALLALKRERGRQK